jgi:predicted RNase H-like nuclease
LEFDVVIGIDCATKDNKVGLARAFREKGQWVLREARAGSRAEPTLDVVGQWLAESADAILLALDAPLGWPRPLKAGLRDHVAGAALAGNANELFRRMTDLEVRRRVKKTPLDVGADRIARTAHWALKLLEELRKQTGEPIPLAWSIRPKERISAIEVYPAATLIAGGKSLEGYKDKDARSVRNCLVPYIAKTVGTGVDSQVLLDSPDAFDAALCVLAGVDFLQGKAPGPADLDLAKEEGWIWFRSGFS